MQICFPSTWPVTWTSQSAEIEASYASRVRQQLRGGSRGQCPKMSVKDRSPRSHTSLLEQPSRESADAAQLIFLLLSTLSPTNKNKTIICSCGTPKLQSQGYIITCTISSNNACIVQGANQERNCHHPLHWVVFSDLSGSVDCPRNKGLQKFVPSACICQSRELLNLADSADEALGSVTEAVFFWRQCPAGQWEWRRSVKGKHYFISQKRHVVQLPA